MSEMIARRYARAAFELAKEQGKVSELSRELNAFADAYASSSEFRDIDTVPSLQGADRRAIVESLGKRLSASDLTTRTVAMIAERQRLSLLPDLVRVVEEMADDHLGVLRGTVTSATRLDEGYRGKLKRKIEETTGKKVILTFEEDENLIAGIVTQIGDRVIDGTVRGKLNQLAESIRQT
jgi:F-type H+-transporting ATPase subunit delta